MYREAIRCGEEYLLWKIQEIKSVLINVIGCQYLIAFHEILRLSWIVGWPDFYVKVLGEGFIYSWHER